MFNRFFNRFRNDQTDETSEKNVHKKRNYQKSTQRIETKVTYQYPKDTPFRFPVIPDEDPLREQRRTKRQRERRRRQEERKNIHQRKRKRQEKETKRPFTPTKFASPVYGYHRELDKTVQETPTYIRRREEEKRKQQALESERRTEQERMEQMQADRQKVNEQKRKHRNQSESIHKDTQQEKKLLNKRGSRQSNPLSEASHESTRRERVETHASQNQTDNETYVFKNKRINRKQDISSTKHSPMQGEQQGSFDPNLKQRSKSNVSSKQAREFGHDETKINNVQLDEKARRQSEKRSLFGQKEQNYEIPLYLLDEPIRQGEEDTVWMYDQKELLEQTLQQFNVDAKVVHVTQGPTVTRFEVQPELGVKVSRVRNLSDDIKMNMAERDIRIEAPIPGKNTIGIEIPNEVAQTVGLHEIIETDEFWQHSSKLSVGLGLSLEGNAHITAIDDMPHGLIAGATGSGKGGCINTIILSLLYKSSYEDVKLLLIDPKMVELAAYNGIPHLLSPVITDVKAATAALKWAVQEMEERYEKFVKTRVRDIHRYNEKAKETGAEKMPHIVIIIDELSDLMMIAPQDVEASIIRIAQKARACGMHLLIATQRPSVDVITGLIKANIPTRIAFSVSSQVDSRTILDTNGAERLLGRGDMLFAENGASQITRLQGAFVSDDEIDRVTEYVRNMAEPEYLFEQDELLEQIDFEEEVDELFEDVVQFILEYEQASTSLLQRHFRIGYNRAARIIDTLEERGMISESKGSRPRDVLFTIDDLDKFL